MAKKRTRSARPAEGSQEDARQSRAPALIVALALMATTLVVYWPVLGHGFVYDDAGYILANARLQDGLTLDNVRWALTTNYESLWQPLVWISYMVDVSLGGMKPTVFHLTNLLLHAAATLLLFLFLNRATGRVWRSAFVAALFALHPLRVESVAWVTERKDVLSGFFWMAAILAYVFYKERPRIRRYLMVAAAFALGLMSKAMVVTLPFALLLLDYWPLRRDTVSWKRRIVEKVPLFVMAAIASAITYMVNLQTGTLRQMPLPIRIETALISYAGYLRKTLWPNGLAAHYPHPNTLFPSTWVIAAGLALAAVSAPAIVLARSNRYLVTGWLWYLGTLLPVIGLVQVGTAVLMADRFTYVPLVGVSIMAAWGIPDLLGSNRSRSLATGLAVAAGIVVAASAVAARIQVGYWKDEFTLWQRALDVTHHNARAFYNLGHAFQEQGNLDEAAALYREAIKIDPNYFEAHNNLGNILHRQGRYDEAIEAYEQVLRIRHEDAEAENNIGAALQMQGKIEEAAAHYAKAVKIKPDYAEAHNNLGIVLAARGRTDEAIREYEKAIRLKPDYASAHGDLAVIFYNRGDHERAWKELRLCQKYGGSPAPALVQALSRRIPKPSE